MWRSLLVFVTVWSIAAIAAHPVFTQAGAGDFISFYVAAQVVHEHANPYDTLVMRNMNNGERVWPYLYSPLLAVLLMPFTRLPIMTAFKLWTYLSAGAFGFSAALTTHRTRTSALVAIAFAGLAGLGLNVVNVFQLGQVNVFVVAAITVAFTLRERKPITAGVFLALAAVLKSSPFYLLIVIAAERRGRMLASTLATTLALCLFALAFTGTKSWETFYYIGQRASHGTTLPGLFAFDVKWSFSFLAVLLREKLDAALLVPIISLVLSVPVALAAWRGRKGTLLSALVVMVLTAPFAYLHHVIYVFPGVLSLLVDAHVRRRNVYAAALLLLSFAAGVDFPVQDLAGNNLAALMALYALGFLA